MLGSTLGQYALFDKNLEHNFFLKPSLPVLIEGQTLMSIRSVTVRYLHNTATSSTMEEI